MTYLQGLKMPSLVSGLILSSSLLQQLIIFTQVAPKKEKAPNFLEALNAVDWT